MAKHHVPPPQGFDLGHVLSPEAQLRLELKATKAAAQQFQAQATELGVLLSCALAKLPRECPVCGERNGAGVEHDRSSDLGTGLVPCEGSRDLDVPHLAVTTAEMQAAGSLQILPGETVKSVYVVRTPEEVAAAQARWAKVAEQFAPVQSGRIVLA